MGETKRKTRKPARRARKRRRSSPSSGQLVVVSNRLPFTTEKAAGRLRFRRSPGGLVSALEPALARSGGVWIGWPGAETEDAASAAEMLPPRRRAEKVRYQAVSLTRREVALYYDGFSNRTLWPLFHYFVTRTEIDSTSWEVYERINERFATVTAEESTDSDLVWVHDYQLMRVPRYLRRIAPDRRIAFFLHIPFPAYDVFRVLPWARFLMRGLLSCDLVGCQSVEHAEHIMTCAELLLGCSISRVEGVVQFEGRPVAIQAHPIGIDYRRFEELAAKVPAQVPDEDRPLQILGVDRLDYTKGILERLLAVENFFERFPEYRRRIVFVQVCVPSRTSVVEYQALKREVDETVGRINGRFSDASWAPIRYLVRTFNEEELVALYRSAAVALVTPLRDGMNLVAKEYVAAQGDRCGVLILSELAGAAEEMKEALLVNPYDVEAVADAIHHALEMPEDECRSRMVALRHRVETGDVQNWVGDFVKSADEAARRARSKRGSILSPTDVVRRRLHPWLAKRATVSIFFDYDGTLTPIVDRPENAHLSPLAHRLLRQAVRTPNLEVSIVSGRGLADIKNMVEVAGITYVGNHGFEIEGPGIKFRHEALDLYQEAVEKAAQDLSTMREIEGLWVERKGATLTVHLREVAEAQRRRAERRAAAIMRRHQLRVTLGKRIVEGRPPIDWNKGYAVLHVLARRYGADWVKQARALYIGDDVTDEDAFRSLRGMGRSIRVGPATDTDADMMLPDPDAVIALLRWLASGAFETDTV